MTPPESISRILVATDRSATAERAVAWAADMADRYGAELWLLQVLVPADTTGGSTAVERSRLYLQEQELALHAREIAGESGRALVVIDDDPAAAIVEAAEAEKIDVVVVGNAGMTGRKEFLLGNVPNRVSHNARCTVVIVNSTLQPPGDGDDGRGLFRRKR